MRVAGYPAQGGIEKNGDTISGKGGFIVRFPQNHLNLRRCFFKDLVDPGSEFDRNKIDLVFLPLRIKSQIF